jgi:iron complex outermembrane receptor protein
MFRHFASTKARIASALLLASIATAAPGGVAAQQGGTLVGTVTAADASPVAGARITLEPGNRGTVTDARGSFRITSVPAGTFTVRAAQVGYAPGSETVVVAASGETRVDLVMNEQALVLDAMVVSASRESQRLLETPASIGIIGGEEIRASGVAHPSEIMRLIPGVWVNVTGGEGHQTSIRQPLTTNPVYLYLEDGIPTRSTGFFNHNALYEINVPQSDRIEVTKGPVTALYGSDAIGGIIDVGTRAPSDTPEIGASLEGGSFGWQRALLTGSNTFGVNGLRADINLTRTDGWRDATDYDRQSATFRWDRPIGSTGSMRTVASFSNIDQNTAGSSAINETDYLNDPEINYTPISYRKVKAFRLSTELGMLSENTLFTLTPFVRWNEMELLANWSLTYDPTVYTTGHRSAGILAKARRDFEPMRARVIAGVDLDYSPGYRQEDRLVPTRQGSIFTSYTLADRVYDYDVAYHGISPYIQAEASPLPRMRVVAGLRYDRLGFDYDSHLDPIDTGRHRRPADTSVSYSHLSPKLGATYEVSPAVNLFANYGHGFRAPSEGQLFRQGQSLNTVGLEPVKVNSFEGGLRGVLANRVSYDVTAYHMAKLDDIISFTNPDGSTENVNAGKTVHRGIEAGLGVDLSHGLRTDVAYSLAEHTYEEWSARAGVDLAGNEIETAPNTTLNASLSFSPTFYEGSQFAVELTRVGSYWMDAQNTDRYDGHNLLNLRAAMPIAGGVSVFARMVNATDERFAESASYTVARGREFAPGMARTIYVGIQRN